MENKTLTLYKLIVLYFLDKVDFPLTGTIITSFLLEKGYTNYFNGQLALNELEEDRLIYGNVTHSNTFYRLTDDGRQTIGFFSHELSADIRSDIVDYLKLHQCEIMEQVSIQSDYERLGQNEYLVTCKICEKESILAEVHLNVATEKDAVRVCDNWKRKNQSIYEMLVQNLMIATDSEMN